MGKQASSKPVRVVGRAISWAQVLRVLDDDAARSSAITRCRAAGHTPDDFANSTAARSVMADALTRIEDQVELERTSRARLEMRERIRDVRRQLELELR